MPDPVVPTLADLTVKLDEMLRLLDYMWRSDFTRPAVDGAVITKSDLAVFRPTRALWVGGAGAVSVRFADTQVTCLLSGIAAGTLLPLRVDMLYDTATTATLVAGLW